MGTLKDGTYNGWTNYATWRVRTDFFDNMDLKDYRWHRMEAYDLGPILMDYVEDMLRCDAAPLVYDYAMAFLSDVNWREIAAMMLSGYASEDETETEDA